MKLIVAFTFLTFMSSLAFGQNNEGKIVFEEKRNIHKQLPPEMEAMKDRIPEFRTSKKVLYFNQESAVYKKIKEDKPANEEFRGEGRRGRRGRRGNNDNVYFTDLGKNISVDSRDFFGKKFLIEGERESKKWKMTGDQKMVGDYLCQKASFQDSTQNIIVWFTPMIPVSTGPDDYFGLPGMILHVDINEGEMLYTAQTIELQEIEDSLIDIPTEGKKMTKNEFEELRDKKMEEMKQEFGGEGRGRMFRRGR